MKLFFYLILAILISGCNQQKDETDLNNDLNKYHLFGRVKSMSEFSYEAIDRFGEISKGKSKRDDYGFDHHILFNTNGYVIEANYYYYPGRLANKYIYKYESDNNLSEYRKYSEDGNLFNSESYEYNDKGKKIKTQRYISNLVNQHITIIHKYDDFGNNIEDSIYNSDGLISIHKFKCDISGKRIEEKDYDADGKLNLKIIIEYDNRGNEVERKYYNKDGKIYIHTSYKYDDAGNNIEVNQFDDGGNLKSKTTSKYDDKYNNIENDIYDENNHLKFSGISKYEFDKKGNWIKCVEYDNNLPTYIKERKIEYY